MNYKYLVISYFFGHRNMTLIKDKEQLKKFIDRETEEETTVIRLDTIDRYPN